MCMDGERNPSLSKEGDADDAKTQDKAGGAFNVPRVATSAEKSLTCEEYQQKYIDPHQGHLPLPAGTEKNVQYLSLKTLTESGSLKDNRG